MPATDARILLQLLRGQSRNGTHAERLQAFYAPQASRYDRFRERLLHGRQTLIDKLQPSPGEHIVELGGGTGRNLLYFGDRLGDLNSFDLVDLCPALLEQARVRSQNMPNVSIVEADASTWRPERPVDIVYFSYSLTMIPNWRSAIDNAVAMLRPGGQLGVVDFYVSGSTPGTGRVRHSSLKCRFWRRWFAHDGVRLDPAHLDHLIHKLPDNTLIESQGSVPYLPGIRVPYYVFIGRKPA